MFRDHFLYIKDPKPIVLNSFGIIVKNEVKVSLSEALYLARNGLLNSSMSSLEIFDNSAGCFDIMMYSCVGALKDNNFITTENEKSINVHYPGIRKKTTAEKASPFEVVVHNSADTYEIDPALLEERSGKLVICLSEAQNSELFIQISSEKRDTFTP